VNLKQFLSRQDAVWNALPTRWEEGAFIGDGDLGAMIWRQPPAASTSSPSPPRESLGWEVNRASVVDRGHRIPMARLSLLAQGEVASDDEDSGREVARLDLATAQARGILRTGRGQIAWRSWAHRTAQVLVIETDASPGERAFTWKLQQHPALDPRATHQNQEVPPEKRPPDAQVLQRGVVRMVRQPLQRGAYVLAWREQVLAPGRKRVLLTVGFAQNEDASQALEAAESQALTRLEAAHAQSSRNARSWEESHGSWWRGFWNQSWVSLPDARMESFYALQMYKLGSAMRADGPPCDLMGPWFRDTPWPAIWWNLNIQLTYWPVYASNHLELGRSFSDSIDRNLPALIENVRPEWRGDSAAIGRTSSFDLRGAEWKEFGNLVWALQLYDFQARYEADPATARRLFPILHRAVSYMDRLLERGDDGKLHFPIGISPEYPDEAADAHYNLSLMRWGCRRLLDMARELKIDDAKGARWRQVLAELAPYPIDEKSGLMIGRGVPLAQSHRHYSHLLAWYPLGELSADDPQTRPLLERSLDHWIGFEGALQGYSFTGAASMAATLSSDPRRREDAVRYLGEFLDRFVKPNTMYTEAGPVIETPLSAAQSIHELLLQERRNVMHVFPAIPASWRDVSFFDLRTPGAFLISAQRRGGTTQWIRVRSLRGGSLRLACDIPALAPDKRLKRDGNAWLVSLAAEEEITLGPRDVKTLAALAPVENPRERWNAWGSQKPIPRRAAANGAFELRAHTARRHGEKLLFQTKTGGDSLGRWIEPGEWASWILEVRRAGRYRVRVTYASPGAGSRFALVARPLPAQGEVLPGARLEGSVQSTGSFDDFRAFDAGEISLQRGRARLEARALEIKGALWNLQSIELIPAAP
jgi:hypothetical protein